MLASLMLLNALPSAVCLYDVCLLSVVYFHLTFALLLFMQCFQFLCFIIELLTHSMFILIIALHQVQCSLIN